MLLYDLMEAARLEQGYPEKATDWYRLINEYEKGYSKFLEYNEDGFIAGNYTEEFYLMLDVPIVLEIAWYVTPEKRSTGIGMELYNKLEEWARRKGAKYMLQGRPTKGCTKVGPYYLKELV